MYTHIPLAKIQFSAEGETAAGRQIGEKIRFKN
jgi:hypothetical protein